MESLDRRERAAGTGDDGEEAEVRSKGEGETVEAEIEGQAQAEMSRPDGRRKAAPRGIVQRSPERGTLMV